MIETNTPAQHSFLGIPSMLRIVLITLAVGVAPCLLASEPVRAPFKVLYSNDSTNILSCISPYHHAKQELTDDMLRATIDEAVGVDAHMLQPGLGAIPFWQSKVYPLKEHFRYYEEKYHYHPSGFASYLIAGGDFVKTFVEHCRRKSITPFISVRMNDGHGLENVGTGNRYAADTVSRFYEDHYLEYRLGPNPKDWNQRVLNWAIPQVRQYKLALLRELCENYDLAGLELDFMRHSSYFQLDKTTGRQRQDIMTGFVGQVRELLDRTSRPGQRRWLCVRVPALLEAHDAMGFDLPAMVRAGVDMVNLSASYFTIQQTDLRKIRALIPNAAVYLEMTHTTLTGPSRGGYDAFLFERTTPEQFSTTANLAYLQGADGVSLFNFAYYREHGGPGRGPFDEPPFDVLRHLGDRPWLTRQAQWYHLATVGLKHLFPSYPLPKYFLRKGQTEQFALDLAPTDHQQRDGVLRLVAREPLTNQEWIVVLNDKTLERAELVVKPLASPYRAGVFQGDQIACFRCPRSAVKAGHNTLIVTLKNGTKSVLNYLDLVLP